MPLPRKKSCRACARAKRRCDLDLPTCQRCLARGVTCVYPWADSIPSNSLELTSRQAAGHLPAPSMSVPLPLSPAMLSLVGDILAANQPPWLPGSCPPVTVRETTPSLVLPGHSAPPAIGERLITGAVYQPRTEYAGRRLASQAYALVASGHNAFVHHTQTASSPELQDALAASALFCMRNSSNAALVQGEVQRRAGSLVQAMDRQLAWGDGGPHAAADMLPPLQALVVYQCLRLFGERGQGTAGLRAQAQRDHLTMLAWAERLRSEIQPWCDESEHSAGDEAACVRGHGPQRSWAVWVRQEAVRRTVVSAELLAGIDAFLTRGWDRCHVRMAGLGFTAQTALWEAPDADAWQAAYCQSAGRTRRHLKTGIVTFDQDQAAATPDDVDDLAIVVRATYHGLDALADWLGRDQRLLRKWGLLGS